METHRGNEQSLEAQAEELKHRQAAQGASRVSALGPVWKEGSRSHSTGHLLFHCQVYQDRAFKRSLVTGKILKPVHEKITSLKHKTIVTENTQLQSYKQ